MAQGRLEIDSLALPVLVEPQDHHTASRMRKIHLPLSQQVRIRANRVLCLGVQPFHTLLNRQGLEPARLGLDGLVPSVV